MSVKSLPPTVGRSPNIKRQKDFRAKKKADAPQYFENRAS
jgi:hypothetical protein